MTDYRMVKIMMASVLAVCLLLCGACGSAGEDGKAGQEPVFTLDVAAAGERLFHELEYRDELAELAPAVVYALLGVDSEDVVTQKNYFSSTATAEEIIVFLAAGQEAAGRLKLALEARIEDQKDLYVSYAPEEVVYLNSAVLEQKGDYLIFCVAADPVAAKKLAGDILAGNE